VVVTSSTTAVNGANITLSVLERLSHGLGPSRQPRRWGNRSPLSRRFPNYGGILQTTNVNGSPCLPVWRGDCEGRSLKPHGNTSELVSGFATITKAGSTGFGTLQFRGSGTVTGSVTIPKNAAVLGATIL